MYDSSSNDVVKIDNIHSHWRFEKFAKLMLDADEEIESSLDSLLTVDNSAVCKLKGRSAESLGRGKRQQH